MQLLYFGWVRQRVGVGRENIDPPEGISNVRQLVEWLIDQSPGHAAALKDISALRVAVNQELTTLDAAISAGDEVAVFPPMTGG